MNKKQSIFHSSFIILHFFFFLSIQLISLLSFSPVGKFSQLLFQRPRGSKNSI
jgi:hypothetical protein